MSWRAFFTVLVVLLPFLCWFQPNSSFSWAVSILAMLAVATGVGRWIGRFNEEEADAGIGMLDNIIPNPPDEAKKKFKYRGGLSEERRHEHWTVRLVLSGYSRTHSALLGAYERDLPNVIWQGAKAGTRLRLAIPIQLRVGFFNKFYPSASSG